MTFMRPLVSHMRFYLENPDDHLFWSHRPRRVASHRRGYLINQSNDFSEQISDFNLVQMCLDVAANVINSFPFADCPFRTCSMVPPCPLSLSRPPSLFLSVCPSPPLRFASCHKFVSRLFFCFMVIVTARLCVHQITLSTTTKQRVGADRDAIHESPLCLK